MPYPLSMKHLQFDLTLDTQVVHRFMSCTVTYVVCITGALLRQAATAFVSSR